MFWHTTVQARRVKLCSLAKLIKLQMLLSLFVLNAYLFGNKVQNRHCAVRD